jgi:FkbM family methyltransferase
MNTAFIKEVGPLRWAYRTLLRQFFKRILRRDHQMRLPTGELITLPISDHSATETFITNANIDWGTEELLASLLQHKGVFLDVGAHIGYYSLYMLPRVTAVYAFEPDPRVRVFLEKNLSGKPNAEVLPIAVSSAPGKARFTLEGNTDVSHLSKGDEESANQIEVDVTTLDAFAASHNLVVEAIKIDAEGFDTEILQGGLTLLTQQRPLVVTEASPDDTLFALTAQVKYRVFAFIRHPHTRKRSFAELLPNAAVPGQTKMLFLVSQERTAEFANKAAGIFCVFCQ